MTADPEVIQLLREIRDSGGTGGGGTVEVQDDGTTVVSDASTLDFRDSISATNPAGDVVNVQVEDGGITAAKLATDSVTTAKIATGAVDSDEIATDAVTATEIAAGAVGSSEIDTDAVGSDEIATDAVGAAEIATDAVGSDEIATDAVDSDEIATDAVGAAEIAADAVGESELDLSITPTLTASWTFTTINNDDYHESVSTDATVSGATDIDVSSANVFEHTLTGDTTYSFTNPSSDPEGNSFTLIVSQDGTGGHDVTWPGSVEWDNGTEPATSTSANEKHMYGFISPDGGTTWIGVLSAESIA